MSFSYHSFALFVKAGSAHAQKVSAGIRFRLDVLARKASGTRFLLAKPSPQTTGSITTYSDAVVDADSLFSHTVDSDTELLVLWSMAGNTFAAAALSSVTFNGVSLTKKDSQDANVGTNYVTVELWYLLNPPTGTHDIVATFGAAVASGKFFAAVNYKHVKGSGPFGTVQKHAANNATSTSLTLTDGDYTQGDLAIDGQINTGGFATLTIGADQTQLFDNGTVSKTGSYQDARPTNGAVLSWSSSAATWWAHLAVPLLAGDQLIPWERSAGTRFFLTVIKRVSTGVRFRLAITRVAAIRFGLAVTRTAPTRFRLLVARSAGTRFNVALNFSAFTRFVLDLAPAVTAGTRFILLVDWAAAVRFGLAVAVTAGTRFRLVVAPAVTAGTRFRLSQFVLRAAQVRFLLKVAKTASTRFRLALARSAGVRFRLVAVKSAALRFRLAKAFSSGSKTRFNLVLDTRWGTDAIAVGILAEDMDDITTTLNMRSAFASLWGAAPFEFAIGLEALLCTAKPTSTQWTVSRHQRGTDAEPHYEGAVLRELPDTIVITKGPSTWDLTTIAEPEVHHRTNEHGDAEITVDVDTYEPDRYLVSTDARLVLTDQSGPYTGGLTARPSIRRRDDGGAHIAIVARGYSSTLDDPYDDSRIWAAYTPGYQVFRDVLSEKLPLISPGGQISYPGQSLPAPYEAAGQAPRQIFDNVAARGDNGVAVDWAVWLESDGTPKLFVTDRDRQVQLRIPWSTISDVPLAWDVANQVTKVIVKYKQGIASVTAPGATVIRARTFDYSNQIADLASAQGIANQLLSSLATLQAVGDGPVVVEYPKKVYLNTQSDPVEYPVKRIRSNMLVLITDDDLNPITPWNSDLPIGLMRIINTDCDHRTLKNTLSLGEYMPFAAYVGQYLADEKKTLTSPLQEPISGTPAQPPPGVATSVSTSLPGLGSGGRVGYGALAQDADVKTILYAIDNDPDPIQTTAQRTGDYPPIPIDEGMRVVGLRLEGGTLDVTVNKGGAEVGSISSETTIWFAETETVEVEPGDSLTVVVNDNPDDTVSTTLGIIVRLTEGSSRPESGSSPAAPSVTLTRDGDNVGSFLITSDRPVYAQVEYGLSTSYGSWSQKGELLSKTQTIRVPGIPEHFHYRAHVWDADDHQTTGADQAV